jgi:hypothetical protein
MWRRRFCALDTVVEVSCDSLDISNTLEKIFRSYVDDSNPPVLRYDVRAQHESYSVAGVGGELFSDLPLLDVAPCLEFQFLKDLVSRSTAPVIHAASVCSQTSAIVLAGESGAGKTTLTREALTRGLGYITEEAVLLDSNRIVRGLARGIHGEPDDQTLRCDYPWVDKNGKQQSSALFHPPGIVREPMPVVAVFLPVFRPNRPGSVTALSAGEGLKRLWPCVLNPSSENLAKVSAALSGVPIFSLQSSSPVEGFDLIAQAWPDD